MLLLDWMGPIDACTLLVPLAWPVVQHLPLMERWSWVERCRLRLSEPALCVAEVGWEGIVAAHGAPRALWVAVAQRYVCVHVRAALACEEQL